MEHTTEITKSKIAIVGGRLAKMFNLQEWTGDIVYQEDMGGTAAEIHVDETYLDYRITISERCLKKEVEDNNTKEITDWLVHELVHIIVDPIYFMAVDAMTNQTGKYLEDKREQAVQRLTNIMIKGINLEKLWQ